MLATKRSAKFPMYNKTIRRSQSFTRNIFYRHPPPRGMQFKNARATKHLRLVAFPDAGSGSLHGDHSVAGDIIILCQFIDSDFIISRHGHMPDRRCAKIHRVCKSSLAAEAHAAVYATGHVLWLKTLLWEMTTGTYDIAPISPPTDYPIRNPFAPSPTDTQANADWEKQNDPHTSDHWGFLKGDATPIAKML